MPLIECEISLIFTWSANCAIVSAAVANQGESFSVTGTKLYVPVVVLLTQDITKLLQQLKSGFKRTIDWNKYQSKPELLKQNEHLNHMIEPSFQGGNIHFVLSFENDAQRKSNKRYYLPHVEIKNYNVVINVKIFLISQ